MIFIYIFRVCFFLMPAREDPLWCLLEMDKWKIMTSYYEKNEGRTRSWTMDLSICSRLLYHWAIHPLLKHFLQSLLHILLVVIVKDTCTFLFSTTVTIANKGTAHTCTIAQNKKDVRQSSLTHCYFKIVWEIWFEKSGSRIVVDQKKRWFYTIDLAFFRLEKTGWPEKR